MNIKELAKKYGLIEGDFWNHKQSGQWILTHDAVEKIAFMEAIHIVDIKVMNSEPEFVRLLITMSKGDVIMKSIGEADNINSKNNYYGSIA